MNREQLLSLIPNCAIAVELGVASGDYSDKILSGGNIKLLYSIDQWSDRGHGPDQYIHTVKRLAPKYLERSCIIKRTFEQACVMFPDKYFDFIYIDGYAHTGQNDGETLEDWWPKIKDGGIFAGHDYDPSWPKTIVAVDAFCAAHDLKLTLTTGDQYSSWWIKNGT